MKTRILGLIAMAAIVYSCASKQATPPPVIAPTTEELKVTQITKPDTSTKTMAEIAGPVEPIGPLGDAVAHGKILYENNCGRCHRLFGPKEFTNDQWKPLVLRMQKNTPLNDVDIAKVLAYVTSENK